MSADPADSPGRNRLAWVNFSRPEKASLNREELIERMCAAFVGEAVEIFPYEVWPESPEDDGHRGECCYVRLMDDNRKEVVRAAMGFALDALASWKTKQGIEP